MKKNNYFNENFSSHIWPFFKANSEYSAHAKENIYSSLKKFSVFTQKDPLDIVEEDALTFITYLERKTVPDETIKYSPAYVMTVYRQLRGFYKFLYTNQIYINSQYHTSIFNNPFAEVFCSFPDRELVTMEDIPSIVEIDRLLSSVNSLPLLLAIKLSIKMGFTAKELINLKKGQFIEKNSEVYIEMIDKTKKGSTYCRTLHVPGDMMIEINNVISQFDETEEYLIVNIGNNGINEYTPKPYTLRTIQRHLQQCCENANLRSITFSDLRNFFIFQAKSSGIPDSEIAEFTNQEGRWIRRFEITDLDSVHNAADYINIYFK